MKLSQQASNATTPAQAKMSWPTFQPPPVHPTFGMTSEHLDYIANWYSSVQGAVQDRLDAQSAEISALKAKLPTV